MGFVIGKVVSYFIRCKICRVCSYNKIIGREKKYDCWKNYNGLLKLMEWDVVCELWSKVFESGVKFFIFVGDDDLIILVDIKNKVFYGVEKWFDVVYVKRFLNFRLYNFKDWFKSLNCLILS